MRPLNWNFASATAARKDTSIAITSVADTMMRLFFTFSQKNGRSIASVKWVSVGCSENHVGVRLLISLSGLKAVETIQKTGNAMIANTIRPTMFHAARRARFHRRRRTPPDRHGGGLLDRDRRRGLGRRHATSPSLTFLRM